MVEVAVKVHVDEIPPEGLTIDLEEDGNRLFKNEPLLRFDRKIRSHLTLQRVGESVALAGETVAGLFLQCSRCLEEFRFDIDRDFSLEYRPVSEVSEKAEIELTADELDVQYYSEGAIDLDEVIMGQVAEGVPFKPLCADTCRGLCPHCGKNLNQGECGCEPEPINPGLAKLKDLLKKQEPLS